jgi:hypothetical protein
LPIDLHLESPHTRELLFLGLVQRIRPLHRASSDVVGTALGTYAADSRLIKTDVP